MLPDRPIKIDVAQVLASKLGKGSRYMLAPVVKLVEKLICQDELNDLLERVFPRRGTEFCEALLDELDVKLDVRGAGRMPLSPRCIVVSNHPLGGLDGISMIAWLSRHYGGEVRFVINDLLMAVEPLRDCFIPFNTTGNRGRQSRDAAAELDRILQTDVPVVIYPAGLVSRLGDDGRIADLEWRKMVVHKAIESKRDIVPVHFGGENRRSFYRLARLRKRLGLKFNYEMVLLPREMVRCKGSRFTLTCGEAIPWQTFKGGAEAKAEAARLREIVYSLPQKYNEEP